MKKPDSRPPTPDSSSPLSSLLIANRGEIASRIIRTCRKMGIRSIAVFSEADRNAPYVAEADTAVYIGNSNPADSYLDREKILNVARQTGADAIHPGYGFLSENAAFARACQEAGIVFVGPHPEAIAAMGSKSQAKTLMMSHGVPVVPGYQGEDQTPERLQAAAIEIGFPVLLKATAGGGGKGMRIVNQAEEVATSIEAAKREALNAFGNDELIIEKYIASGRHIEFQIFGDKHGNTIHLLERECTVQRRYQKVAEESPSPVMDETLRARMGAAAVNAAKALAYDNAGTVEFIYDETSGEFYFLEVNTRLQVEHPVTEEITGLDLVQMQIESAQGMPLRIAQEAVTGKGYALEFRLYAEDPTNDFLPVSGTIHRFEVPKVEGLRVETAIQSGSEISVFYDPMIAKLIVRDENRTSAHRKMAYVLRNLVCLGMTTNQAFLLRLVEHPEFQQGQYDTHFIAKHPALTQPNSTSDHSIALLGIAATLQGWNQRDRERQLLRAMPSGWRNSFYAYQQEIYEFGEASHTIRYRYSAGAFEFQIEESTYQVSLQEAHEQYLRAEINGVQHRFEVNTVGDSCFIHHEQLGNVHLKQQPRFPEKEATAVAGGYQAPMPSQVVKVLVEPGQQVQAGEGLIVLSSMKMENTMAATADGIVEEIYATEGANVAAGFLLLTLTEAEG